MTRQAERPTIKPNWLNGLLDRANPEDGTLSPLPHPGAPDLAAANATRAIAEALEAASKPHVAEIHQQLADERDAAVLNMLLTAMRHAGAEAFTAETVAKWRRARADTEAVAKGESGETIPVGFGPVVQTKHGERLAALMARHATEMAAAEVARREAAAKATDVGASGDSSAELKGD